METLREINLFALVSLFLTVAPPVMAVAYVLRPSERRLALMRPVSLAGLFAGLAGTTLGFINMLRFAGARRDAGADVLGVAAIGAAEALVPLFVGFASLTAAWLLVLAGMRRQGE